MGKTDIVTKNYMRGSDIFADAFNFLIYNGEARIQSQSLQERDATELAVLFSNDSVKNETEVQQKYRDVLKRAVIMQNKEATYLLLGIENQTDIHYAMPVRNMIYDSLQYGKQVMEIAAEHRKKKDRNGTQAEYLSGFYTDRYDVPAAEIAAVAKRKSNDAVKEEMMSDVPKNARITEEKTDIKMTDIEYALLPAWFMTFRYQGILYTVAVNGQTGKVVGNVPSNRFKVGASIAILMTVMVVLCTYVSVFVGGLMTDLYRISAGVGDSGGAFMVFSAYVAGVIYSLVSFWRAINKLHRSRIDIHRFRSYGTIEYVKERQDKTWVR